MVISVKNVTDCSLKKGQFLSSALKIHMSLNFQAGRTELENKKRGETVRRKQIKCQRKYCYKIYRCHAVDDVQQACHWWTNLS